jgi:aminoglycoside phosphotransferase family enzyme/predicted kinase
LSAFPGHLQALLSARAYPHAVRAVELIETHVSWILLTGEFAYKIKRPVQHSFVDQRALDRRQFLCHEEVRLNGRFARELYLGVCPIAARDGEAQVEGPGPVIEYAVRMRQFRRSDELDQLLQTTRLEPSELEVFGGELARIHARLPVAQPTEDLGHGDALVTLILGNVEECRRAGKALDLTFDLHPLPAALEALLVSTARLRSQRMGNGRVRECHGDLHARNIVRFGSRLVAFDCLEFDPALRWIDVADEIAFLLADLEARQRPLHAQAFLAGYLTESGDYQACALQPLFRAHRALVRAKITALSAAQPNTASADVSAARHQYEAYVDSARRAVGPKRPILVLMCGLSGSGKTWLARQLAPALAALHVRSDIERKRLAGLAAMDRTESPVGEGLYSPDASQKVYNRLADCATGTLRGGYTTIVDATFGRAEDRSRFRELAASLRVRTCVTYCHAPRQVLAARIAERQRNQHDPSEADLAVLAWQEASFEPPEPHEAIAVLEAQSPEPVTIEALIQRISALSAS